MCKRFTALSREAILRNVYCQLVNKESNSKWLAREPHKDVLDLAVRYKVIVHEHEHCMSSFIMNNVLCSRYGIGLMELDAVARRNTKEKGFRVLKIGDLLTELAYGQDRKREIARYAQLWYSQMKN